MIILIHCWSFYVSVVRSSHCSLFILNYCRSCPFHFTASSCWTWCERLLFLNRCIKVRVGKFPPAPTLYSIMSSESKRQGWRKRACFTHDRHLNTWSKWSKVCHYYSKLLFTVAGQTGAALKSMHWWIIHSCCIKLWWHTIYSFRVKLYRFIVKI